MLHVCIHTHIYIHTSTPTAIHPAAGILYNLFRCFKQSWNTMIVIKHSKHPPTLSINAAKPPKRNFSESCYFSYFFKAFILMSILVITAGFLTRKEKTMKRNEILNLLSRWPNDMGALHTPGSEEKHKFKDAF